MSAAKMNHTDINTAKQIMMSIITHAWMKGEVAQNIMLHGSPGTGKSAVIKQMRKDLEAFMSKHLGRQITVKFIDIRLGSMESSEVNGMPYNKTNDIEFIADVNGKQYPVDIKEMEFSTPAWFPTDEPDTFYILFLDELTNASISVQHAAYRLLLDRDIQNGTKLPDTVAIIGAGNLREDKTGAKPLAPAAANRFAVHLVIDRDMNYESALEHMVRSGFSEEVVGYLTWKPTSLYNMDTGEAAWASNRTWEFVDGHVKNPLIRQNETHMAIVVAGAVGSAIGIDFMGYLEFRSVLPDFKKVRSGELEYTFPRDNQGVVFAVTTSVAFQIMDVMKMEDVKQANIEMGYLCDICAQAPNEMLIVMFRTILSMDGAGAKIFSFPALREQYKKVAHAVKKVNVGE